MGIFDGVAQSLERQAAAAVAQKMGIDPSLAQIAIGALTQNHTQPGDTVQQSAQQTGISPDILTQIVSSIGGAGGLGALVNAMGQTQGQAAPVDPSPAAAGGLGGILAGLGGLGGVASMLDRDGDGNPLDDIAGMLGKK